MLHPPNISTIAKVSNNNNIIKGTIRVTIATIKTEAVAEDETTTIVDVAAITGTTTNLVGCNNLRHGNHNHFSSTGNKTSNNGTLVQWHIKSLQLHLLALTYLVLSSRVQTINH
ncbi:hypothetical protein Bca52824_074681 [Brassica carinata]|uniref:Uncharacterized protein n=1 Tax=Brassica carinata TaxID=52824 RepID=A0A8X7PRD0_BRACI|nr:hypothetical protein Bca52824_074681 [Brassica carinata]